MACIFDNAIFDPAIFDVCPRQQSLGSNERPFIAINRRTQEKRRSELAREQQNKLIRAERLSVPPAERPGLPAPVNEGEDSASLQAHIMELRRRLRLATESKQRAQADASLREELSRKRERDRQFDQLLAAARAIDQAKSQSAKAVRAARAKMQNWPDLIADEDEAFLLLLAA